MQNRETICLSRLIRRMASGLLLLMPVVASADVSPGDFKSRISEQSNGEVTVIVDDALLEKILFNAEPAKKPATEQNRGGYGRSTGYRIQVFSDGRNQHTLEARAKARGNAIIARFPKYRGQVYTQSSAPNWYARVGNFRTQQEAQSALEELQRAFPQYRSEMRIVKSKIVTGL